MASPAGSGSNDENNHDLFAFVQFIEDKATLTVPIKDVKRFNGEIGPDKIYKIKYTDNKRYPGIVVALGATENEAIEKAGRKRIRQLASKLLPNLNEFITSSEDQTASESEGRQKKPMKKKETIQKKMKSTEVTAGCYERIINKSQTNENEVATPAMVSQRSKEKVEFEKLLENSREENKRLRSELKASHEKCRELEKLNFKLQSVVIEKFESLQVHQVHQNNEKENLGICERAEDLVHLSQGVYLPSTIFDNIYRKKKNSIFVKELAVALFSEESLLHSTVTGAHGKEKLDPTKLRAIEDVYKVWLKDRGADPTKIQVLVCGIDKLLNEKIQDLRRPKRPKEYFEKYKKEKKQLQTKKNKNNQSPDQSNDEGDGASLENLSYEIACAEKALQVE